MIQEEFKIDTREETFRFAKCSPVDLLAIVSQMDFEKYESTKQFINFALEHIEVKQGEKWIAVKVPNREIYMPNGIENDLVSLSMLSNKYMQEVILKTFQKSSE